MIAVIPVRDGVLPLGADETAAEAGWLSLLVGTGTERAANDLRGRVVALELESYGPAAAAAAVSPHVIATSVVFPASADGRDLAPRLAALLDRPLYSPATLVSHDSIEMVRLGGLALETVEPASLFVATLQPGVRGVGARPDSLELTTVPQTSPGKTPATLDAEVLEIVPPDPATIDLSEAPRILGGGAGLDGQERFDQLSRIAARLGASVGATRVITDRKWIGHERQIGTTGVVVNPDVYLAFGISGAVQHTSGLGSPSHIVAVNTDPHCPMMQMADLAIVADANSVLDALEAALDD